MFAKLSTVVCVFVSGLIVGEFRETLACNCVCGIRGRYRRIIGGQEAQSQEQPWTTALMRNDVVYCGATIISRNYLLTAAHCIYTFAPNEISIHLGGHRIIPKYSQMKTVISIIHHELFDVVTFNNDIGLIQVEKPLNYGPNIQPACLPTIKDSSDYAGQLGLVMGWGRDAENGQLSEILKYISVPIWSKNKCRESGYGPQRLSPTMMCAGYEEGLIDACQGDSGGPMLRTLDTGTFEVIGIISWGRGCGRPNFPGIYTNVARYRKWLEKGLENECLCSTKK